MRAAAFVLLILAALDVGLPFVDRAGIAAAGVACMALALPAPPRRIRRFPSIAVPPTTVELPAELDGRASSLAERLAGYADDPRAA